MGDGEGVEEEKEGGSGSLHLFNHGCAYGVVHGSILCDPIQPNPSAD